LYPFQILIILIFAIKYIHDTHFPKNVHKEEFEDTYKKKKNE